MIAICIFSVLIQTIFCAECDGEVTTCSSCTSSSETFAQCQWCSSNGNCNGKFDVASNCPNGGQWLYDCATGSCSAFETTNIEATRSHQCNTSTTDQCVTTSCAVFVAKITRLSAACIQFQQTACKTFGCSDNCVVGNDGYGNVAPTPLAPAPTPAPAPAPTRKASVYTPARTCQTANFCKTNCGISGTVTQNSVSWGICCADCTKADTIQQVNGVCSNSCASSGPEPAATPAPTQKNIAADTNRANCVACQSGNLQWALEYHPVWCMNQGGNCADPQQNARYCYDVGCQTSDVAVSDCNTESTTQLTHTDNSCVEKTMPAVTKSYNVASKSTVSTVIIFTMLVAVY